MKPKNELLFLALGGSGEIGMNVNLYGCNGKWIMVDLGISFSDPHLVHEYASVSVHHSLPHPNKEAHLVNKENMCCGKQ